MLSYTFSKVLTHSFGISHGFRTFFPSYTSTKSSVSGNNPYLKVLQVVKCTTYVWKLHPPYCEPNIANLWNPCSNPVFNSNRRQFIEMLWCNRNPELMMIDQISISSIAFPTLIQKALSKECSLLSEIVEPYDVRL